MKGGDVGEEQDSHGFRCLFCPPKKKRLGVTGNATGRMKSYQRQALCVVCTSALPFCVCVGRAKEATGFQVLCRHPAHVRERNLACEKKRAFSVAGGRAECLAELRQWILLGHDCKTYAEHQEAWRVVLAQKKAGTLPSSEELESKAFDSWSAWAAEPLELAAQASGEQKRPRPE